MNPSAVAPVSDAVAAVLVDAAEDVGESKRADRAVLLVERNDRVLGALLCVEGVELGNGEVSKERRRRPCLAPDALWSSDHSKLSSFRGYSRQR